MAGLHQVLVVDIGGGTTDICIISFVDACIVTRAIKGDNHLGGLDFDEHLMNHCLSVINDTHKKDIKEIKPSQKTYLLKAGQNRSIQNRLCDDRW